MKFDVAVPAAALKEIPDLARRAEELGAAGLWSSETQRHPFLSLPLVAEHTTRLEFGTAVAIGFGRSPLTLAHTAWDLAEQSNGRFIMGLGTGQSAHRAPLQPALARISSRKIARADCRHARNLAQLADRRTSQLSRRVLSAHADDALLQPAAD